METKLIKEEIEEIEMPAEMRERIIKKCRQEAWNKENQYMKYANQENNVDITDSAIETMTGEQNRSHKRNKSGKKWTRFATVAAAVALCLGLGGITAMAAGDKMEGFFADVVRWDGAVVGTTYEQATEEIEVSVSVSGDSLIVDALLLKAEDAPYVYFDSFGVQAYSIEDGNGNVVAEGDMLVTGSMTDGKVSVELPVGELESDSYTLIITEFVGKSKADQDLPIRGYWVCEFAR